MTTQQSDYTSFANNIRGKVTYPGYPRYDALRTPWLQVIDQLPALIVEGASVDDFAASVNLARERGLRLGIMTTGHGRILSTLTSMSRSAQCGCRATFGAEKFARLREIERKYDPTNLFRLNLNVTPRRDESLR